MSLLNTVNLPNALAAHGRYTLAVYSAGVVTVYAKDDKNNTLIPGQTYNVADVLKIACSENGSVIVVQTATNTIRLQDGTQTVFDMVGEFDCADSGYFVAVNPSINTIHSVKDTTRNINATVSAADRVACGKNKFVVYDSLRYISGFYSSGVPQQVTPPSQIKFVIHVKDDNFAFFYANGTVTYKGNTNTVGFLSNHRNVGKHIVSSNSANDYYSSRDFPLSKAKPFRGKGGGPIVSGALIQILETPIVSSQFQYSESFSSDDSRLFVPTLPLTSYDQSLALTTHNTPAGLTYSLPHALGGDNISMAALNTFGYFTKNKGVAWTALSAIANYAGGKGFQFKGRVYVSDDKTTSPTTWRNYDAAMTAFTTISSEIDANPSNVSMYGAKNANCVVASTAQVANGNNIYICWNMPTFTPYNVSLGTNVSIRYIGCNVFLAAGFTGSTRLFYIPATQGAPVLLKTFAENLRIHHIGNNLIVAKDSKTKLYTAPLAARTEDPATSLANAQTYANEIETALNNLTLSYTAADGTDYHDNIFQWGLNRLVIISRKFVRIWDINT